MKPHTCSVAVHVLCSANTRGWKLTAESPLTPGINTPPPAVLSLLWWPWCAVESMTALVPSCCLTVVTPVWSVIRLFVQPESKYLFVLGVSGCFPSVSLRANLSPVSCFQPSLFSPTESVSKCVLWQCLPTPQTRFLAQHLGCVGGECVHVCLSQAICVSKSNPLQASFLINSVWKCASVVRVSSGPKSEPLMGYSCLD